MSVLKWVLGGMGWALGGPIGAIVGVALASLFDGARSLPSAEEESASTSSSSSSSSFSSSSSSSSTYNRSRRRTNQGNVRISILVLIAAVMKADGHVRKSELDRVKRYLLLNYSESEALEALQVLKGVLNQDFDPLPVAQQIAEHVNYSTRLEMLHFLLDLAFSDGEYAPSEERLIVALTAALRLSPADYRSLLSLYQKEDPDWAYTALEITPGATNEEVKKAYRRMAMKYHPDKVAGAGEDMVKKAEEKFRAINEAYETIKKQRGM